MGQPRARHWLAAAAAVLCVCVGPGLCVGVGGRQLPEGNLLLAYAPGCKEEAAVQSAVDGVNVIIWFQSNLAVNGSRPDIQYHLNSTCVAIVAKALRDRGLETTHLISIGGWDAPHPNTALDGAAWFAAWEQWNREEVARPSLGFDGFDGFDWDLEGNDNQSSPDNHFTMACIDVVGSMSRAAKAAGFIVTMVPPESYMDPTTSAFDRSLLHAYPEWMPQFRYHAHSVYAGIAAKYGMETFDIVDIQLYETYAHAAYQIDVRMVPAKDYLVAYVRSLVRGWHIDFASDPALGVPTQTFAVPAHRLVLGFSRGSADGRSLFVHPEAVGAAYAALAPAERPRGVMFWHIYNDNGPVNGTATNCSFARGFNAFLHTRA